MPTDYDFADEKGRNASEEAARDYLWRMSDEISKLYWGFYGECAAAYNDAAGFSNSGDSEENPFKEAYEQSQLEYRKRMKNEPSMAT